MYEQTIASKLIYHNEIRSCHRGCSSWLCDHSSLQWEVKTFA